MSYISGTQFDLETRLHEYPTTSGDISLYKQEMSQYILDSNVVMKLNREIAKKSYSIEGNKTVPYIVLYTDGHGHLSWTSNLITGYAYNVMYSSSYTTGIFSNAYQLETTETLSVTYFDASYTGAANLSSGYLCVCPCDSGFNNLLPYSNMVYSDGNTAF